MPRPLNPERPPPRADEDIVRESDIERHLRNEQGDKPAPEKRMADYQLQVALDYLKSFEILSGRKD